MKKLNLSINKNNPEQSFIRIADELMNKWALISNDAKYRITEIEFYLKNDKWHKDVYTHGHPMQQKSHRWYFHGSGIDITFGQDNFYGGILLRSVYDLTEKNYYYGPLVLLQKLFNNFPNVNDTNLSFGLIPYTENSFSYEVPIAAARVGLNPKHDKVMYSKNYRFLIMPKRKHADKTRIAEAMKKSGKYTQKEIDNIWG